MCHLTTCASFPFYFFGSLVTTFTHLKRLYAFYSLKCCKGRQFFCRGITTNTKTMKKDSFAFCPRTQKTHTTNLSLWLGRGHLLEAVPGHCLENNCRLWIFFHWKKYNNTVSSSRWDGPSEDSKYSVDSANGINIWIPC